MARIRSQHPGQWTDEDFVEMSAFARLMCLGLRNEADDHGCFEWKPKRLKMRLLPADNADPQVLLEEMVNCNQIVRYEAEGKLYGAIRNFCRFQRPKKPNGFCPLPEQIKGYVGLEADKNGTGSEPVGNQFGSSGENEQTEEGNGIPEKSFPESEQENGSGSELVGKEFRTSGENAPAKEKKAVIKGFFSGSEQEKGTGSEQHPVSDSHNSGPVDKEFGTSGELVRNWSGTSGENAPAEGRKVGREVKKEKNTKKERKESSSSDPPKDSESDEAFATWWSVYPRRVARGRARKAWLSVVTSGKATPEELLEGARRYAAFREDKPVEFSKHPATWLNGECWMDEFPAQSESNPSGWTEDDENLYLGVL